MRQDRQDPKDLMCIFKGLKNGVCVTHAQSVVIPPHRKAGPGGLGCTGDRPCVGSI